MDTTPSTASTVQISMYKSVLEYLQFTHISRKRKLSSLINTEDDSRSPKKQRIEAVFIKKQLVSNHTLIDVSGESEVITTFTTTKEVEYIDSDMLPEEEAKPCKHTSKNYRYRVMRNGERRSVYRSRNDTYYCYTDSGNIVYEGLHYWRVTIEHLKCSKCNKFY